MWHEVMWLDCLRLCDLRLYKFTLCEWIFGGYVTWVYVRNNNRVHAIQFFFLPLNHLKWGALFEGWRVSTNVTSMIPMQRGKWGFRVLKCRLSFLSGYKILCSREPLMYETMKRVSSHKRWMWHIPTKWFVCYHIIMLHVHYEIEQMLLRCKLHWSPRCNLKLPIEWALLRIVGHTREHNSSNSRMEKIIRNLQ